MRMLEEPHLPLPRVSPVSYQRVPFFLPSLCLRVSVAKNSPIAFALLQSQHPPVPPLTRSPTRKIIKRTARRLNDMPLDERRPFRRSLFAALDAALPLQHCPPRKVMVRQLGKDRPEIHLPVSWRPKPPRPFHPGLVSPVNPLPPRRTKLCILYVKHLDAAVVQVDELQVIKLLQHEMARVVENIASWMFSHPLEKHFKRGPIVQILARMNLKAQVHARFIKCIQDGPPPLCQLIKSRLNQPRWPLRPRINVRPRQRPRERHVRRKSQIGR